jgi:phosphatidate cytidylyltransferase
MMQETVWLTVGLFSVLIVSSGAAAVLRARTGGADSPTLDNLEARIKAWWVMVVLIGLAILAGYTAVVILFALVSFAALREFVTITYSRRSDHRVLFAMFAIVLPVQYYLIWIDWYGLYSIFIPVYCFLIMPALTVTRGDTQRFLERVSLQQWGIMLAVYCISHVPALLTLEVIGFDNNHNLLLIAFLIITVQGSDVLQYVFGKLFGKHRMSPNVSPSKTWEGLAGGVVSASLLGAALNWLTPFSPVQAGIVAAVCCVMGVFGGLVASAIKRDRGIKDWGAMIEGHGGMLDRTDSLIFAAPIFFHIVRYWWT